MQNSVPYFSQYDTTIPEEWRPRACGVVSLAMALGFILKKEIVAPELIEEGLKINAYHGVLGWRHDVLVELANNRGAHAHREEFKKDRELQVGIEKIKRVIENKGVPIVSIIVPDMHDTHLVPLTGFNNDGFFYHESAKKSNDQEVEYVFISNIDFETRWRRLAIFVEPPTR